MESKTYTIQGQDFTLLPNDLNLLNKAAPMIARLRKLVFEYSKDIDTSEADSYKARINELTEAKVQLEEILAACRDETGNELSEDRRTELSGRVSEICRKIDEVTNDFSSNGAAMGVLKLKQELESYALIELLTDIDFLKPIMKKILKGGNIDKLDYSDPAIIGFIRDVVTDFFTVMNKNSLKL